MGEAPDHRKKEKSPQVAPGMDDEAIKADATAEEIRRGDFTSVTRLEREPNRRNTAIDNEND
ncbi:hypothetical protein [Paludifilum halophilum]|uniref:Uncharacterized protein n=1 Tax=Paludifilum halophilum TaxID=1642702 RepID=A0A235B568_9BACL|nr:hypothetical protein [Paludifilum halophilum]OYD07382.1 hypothetical protein CHM34_10755 [Paludifilum halophilum]